MTPSHAGTGRSRRAEAGLSTFELVMAVAILAVVSFSALDFLDSAAKTVGHSAREVQSLDDARTVLARMENELRASARVQQTASCPLTATCLVITVPLTSGGIQGVRYRYDETAKVLYRATGDPLLDQWDSEAAAVRSVVNGSSPVFCRSSACTTPSDVGATLVVIQINVDPERPAEAIRLESYVTPRNT